MTNCPLFVVTVHRHHLVLVGGHAVPRVVIRGDCGHSQETQLWSDYQLCAHIGLNSDRLFAHICDGFHTWSGQHSIRVTIDLQKC